MAFLLMPAKWLGTTALHEYYRQRHIQGARGVCPNSLTLSLKTDPLDFLLFLTDKGA